MGLFGFNKKDYKKNTEFFCGKIKKITNSLFDADIVKDNKDLETVLDGINDNVVCIFNWRAVPQKGKEVEAQEKWIESFIDEAENDLLRGNILSSSIKIICVTKILRLINDGYQTAKDKSKDLYDIATRLIKIMQCVDIYTDGEKTLKALQAEYKTVENKLHSDYVPKYNAILKKQNEAIDYIRKGTKEYNEQIKNFSDEGFFELNGSLFFNVKKEFLQKAKNLSKGFTWYVPDESEKPATLNMP